MKRGTGHCSRYFLVAAVCTLLIVSVACLFMRPRSNSSASPDGRITVRLLRESLVVGLLSLSFLQEVLAPTVRLEVFDNETHEHRVAMRREQQDAWEYWITGLSAYWHPDGRRVVCVYEIDTLGGIAYEMDAYRVTRDPLEVEEIEAGRWVSEALRSELRSEDEQRRADALAGLTSSVYHWGDWPPDALPLCYRSAKSGSLRGQMGWPTDYYLYPDGDVIRYVGQEEKALTRTADCTARWNETSMGLTLRVHGDTGLPARIRDDHLSRYCVWVTLGACAAEEKPNEQTGLWTYVIELTSHEPRAYRFPGVGFAQEDAREQLSVGQFDIAPDCVTQSHGAKAQAAVWRCQLIVSWKDLGCERAPATGTMVPFALVIDYRGDQEKLVWFADVTQPDSRPDLGRLLLVEKERQR